MQIKSGIFPAKEIIVEHGKLIATLDYRLSAFWRNYFFIKNCAIMLLTKQVGYQKTNLLRVKLGMRGPPTDFDRGVQGSRIIRN